MAEYKVMDEEQWEPLPFLGIDSHSQAQVWTLDGRHWQEGDKAPQEVHDQLLKRFERVEPGQFERSASLRSSKKSSDQETPSMAPVSSTEGVNTGGGENEQERVTVMEKLTAPQGNITNEDGTLKEGVDAPVATGSVTEGTGYLMDTPGVAGGGSLPTEDEEEEEAPATGSGKRKKAS